MTDINILLFFNLCLLKNTWRRFFISLLIPLTSYLLFLSDHCPQCLWCCSYFCLFFFTFITHVCSISNLEHHFMCNWMFHNGTVTGLLNNLCSVRYKDESISFFFIHFLCYISPVLNYLLERYQNFPFISVFKILFKILISLYLKILILKFIWYFKV